MRGVAWCWCCLKCCALDHIIDGVQKFIEGYLCVMLWMWHVGHGEVLGVCEWVLEGEGAWLMGCGVWAVGV